MAKKKEADVPEGCYLGRNVSAKIVGSKLVLEIELTKRLGPSNSKKNTLVATTGGNVFVAEGSDVKIGLNCYVPLEENEYSSGVVSARTKGAG